AANAPGLLADPKPDGLLRRLEDVTPLAAERLGPEVLPGDGVVGGLLRAPGERGGPAGRPVRRRSEMPQVAEIEGVRHAIPTPREDELSRRFRLVLPTEPPLVGRPEAEIVIQIGLSGPQFLDHPLLVPGHAPLVPAGKPVFLEDRGR